MKRVLPTSEYVDKITTWQANDAGRNKGNKMTKSASDGISFLFGGTSEHEYTQDEVVELCKKEQQTTVYTGENYQVELTGTQFVLVHPVSENETFDSFDELVESHPVCEEARGFFN